MFGMNNFAAEKISPQSRCQCLIIRHKTLTVEVKKKRKIIKNTREVHHHRMKVRAIFRVNMVFTLLTTTRGESK
jgi:hypothetical protein